MNNCILETLDRDFNISSPTYFGLIKVELPACMVTIRPITGGNLTATFNGESISVDGTITLSTSGILVINNKYDLKTLALQDGGSFGRATTSIDTKDLSYCTGLYALQGKNLLKGKLSNLAGTSLERLLVPYCPDLVGKLEDIADCPIALFDISVTSLTGTGVGGSLEKYVAKRMIASGSRTGSFQYTGANFGEVTFANAYLSAPDGVKTISWEPNSIESDYTDITWNPGGAGEKTVTIDSNGEVIG